MKGLERTAKAWMDAVQAECPILPPISVATVALQRALLEIEVNEQELADVKQELADFRQRVSDTLREYIECFSTPAWHRLYEFILPEPNPDPLVEIFDECFNQDVLEGETWSEAMARKTKAAMDARGLELRKKNDDN